MEEGEAIIRAKHQKERETAIAKIEGGVVSLMSKNNPDLNQWGKCQGGGQDQTFKGAPDLNLHP